MKDIQENIIYIGKAKNIKKRVKSYFNNKNIDQKTKSLVKEIKEISYIITKNENEALLLENSLINKHKPKYNIRLKNTSKYTYIEIDTFKFPRLTATKNPNFKNEVFGPFYSAQQINLVCDSLTKFFLLRDCSISEFNKRKNPCILYQMGHCSAPCVNLISKEEYDKNLKTATSFLKGSHLNVLKIIQTKMNNFSNQQEFELAAKTRDLLTPLSEFSTQLASYKLNKKSLDIILHKILPHEIIVGIYRFRQSLPLGFEIFQVPLYQSLSSTLFTYYFNQKIKPQHIASTISIPELNKIGIKSQKYKKEIELEDKFELISNNYLNEYISNQKGILELTEYLQIKDIQTIEAYDIAIWQGHSPTGSKVVLENYRLNKSKYKYYKMETIPEKNNDPLMISELIKKRLKNKDSLPDLFVIDGGVAQFNCANNILKKYYKEPPVVSILKSRNSAIADILISLNASISLDRLPFARILLTTLINEAHRFCRKLHHKGEKKRIISSWVQEIPGIGEKTQVKINKNLDISPKDLKELSSQQIMEKFNISQTQAKLIFNYLKNYFA